MDNKNKKNKKFVFVTLDENNNIVEDNSILEKHKIDEEDSLSFKEIHDKDLATTSLKDLVDASLQKPRRVLSPDELDKTEEYRQRKMYVSFETRIALRIIAIILLLGCSSYFIMQAVSFGKKDVITYNEITEANYKVCQRDYTHYYDSNCQEEGLKYSQGTANFINVLFKYNLDYSKKVPYDIAYHIVAVTKIFDKENNTKVLFKNEDVLVERTSLSDISNRIFFDNDLNLDYNHYNEIVKNNIAKYGSDSEADLEVALYLDTDDSATNVASITIPLNEKDFTIRKSALSNLNQSIELDNNTWNNYNSMCAVIATTLIIFALTILYRTTSLVMRVTNNKSTYEKMLGKILNDHDKDIVTAKDGYIIDSNKKIIKVADFKELLDARHLLDKPIIYSKINSIKSEFVVEDESKAFKYVLKDSDL